MIQQRRPGPKKKSQVEVWVRAAGASVGGAVALLLVAGLVVSVITWVFEFCFNAGPATRFHLAPMGYFEALGWLGFVLFIVVSIALVVDRKGGN